MSWWHLDRLKRLVVVHGYLSSSDSGAQSTFISLNCCQVLQENLKQRHPDGIRGRPQRVGANVQPAKLIICPLQELPGEQTISSRQTAQPALSALLTLQACLSTSS